MEDGGGGQERGLESLNWLNRGKEAKVFWLNGSNGTPGSGLTMTKKLIIYRTILLIQALSN